MPTLRRLLVLATALASLASVTAPAGAAVVVSHLACDPIGRTEICADAAVVPIQGFITSSNGTLFAGGAATATHLRAYIHNDFGGAGHVVATYADTYTLIGPGSAPITLAAILDVDGSADRGGPSGGSWSFVAGFKNGPSAYFADPASVSRNSGHDPDYSVFSKLLTRDFMLAPGDSIDLAFEIGLSANHVGATLDFMKTVTLSFSGLPDGYYIRSTTGFDGVGSAPRTGGEVPEPGTLLLTLLAAVVALRSGRTARR